MQSSHVAEKAKLLEKLRLMLNPEGNWVAQQSIAFARRLNELKRGELLPEEAEVLKKQIKNIRSSLSSPMYGVNAELEVLYASYQYVRGKQDEVYIHNTSTEISYPPFPDCADYKDLRILPLLHHIVDLWDNDAPLEQDKAFLQIAMLCLTYNYSYLLLMDKPHEYTLITLPILEELEPLLQATFKQWSLFKQISDLIYSYALEEKNDSAAYVETFLFFMCEHVVEATELFEIFINRDLFTKENYEFIMTNAQEIAAILEIIKCLDQFSCLNEDNLIQLTRHENFTNLQHKFIEFPPKTAEDCHHLLKKAPSLKNICLQHVSQRLFAYDLARVPLELQEAITSSIAQTKPKTL